MNNELKKQAIKLARLFEAEVGELPGGAVFQLGTLLKYYRPEVIEAGVRRVAQNASLSTSEAAFAGLRRVLRGDA